MHEYTATANIVFKRTGPSIPHALYLSPRDLHAL